MTRPISTPTAISEIARLQAAFPRWNASRVLSALGLPGFGVKFAASVLAGVNDGGDLFALALGAA